MAKKLVYILGESKMIDRETCFCGINDNPLRGFAFVQFSNTFNNMDCHFGGNMEVICISVQFPMLRQKKARTILRRALHACREIVNCGIDLYFYTFQIPKDEAGHTGGDYRIVFLVSGGTVCTGTRLCEDLKSKLEFYAEESHFDILLNHPEQDEYEGSLVLSQDNSQMARNWLANFLLDSQACHKRRRKSRSQRSREYCCLPVE